MNVMQLCRESWFFFRQNLPAIFSVLLPSIVISESLYAFASPEPNSPMQMLVIWGPLILLPIFQAALIVMIRSRATGETLSVSDCYRIGAPAYLRLAAVYLIAGVAIMCGFILFVIPGLIIMARLCLAEYYCLFDDKPAYESVQASWINTKAYQWPILGGYLLVMLLQALPVLALDHLLELMELSNPITMFITGALGTVLVALVTVFSFRIYCEIEQAPQADNSEDKLVQ